MSKKKWCDANEILHVAELPDELRALDLEMKKKPNFDHFPSKKRKKARKNESGRTD